ncbi:ultraviolet-B receptor UVR8 [Acrasis kona]|uniref:Ultraviolet-B receptor UVR8 n=1 Tax=Acrasis kona TaxID=1008807 RepID=A0AAW2Z8I2_9EUKA
MIHSVYSFGYNNQGQLATRDTVDRRVPCRIKYLDTRNINRVIAGAEHVMATTVRDGRTEILSAGCNDNGQLALGYDCGHVSSMRSSFAATGNVVDICAGSFHTVMLSSKGTVVSWGYNNEGELGLGHAHHKNKPTVIKALTFKTITNIYVGSSHNFALSSTGEVYGWGKNGHGQLSLGHFNDCTRPVLIKSFNVNHLRRVIHLERTSGERSRDWIATLLPNLRRRSSGHDQHRDADPYSIKSISAGGNHTIILTNNNQVLCCGGNGMGQLGLSDAQDRSTVHWLQSLKSKVITNVFACSVHSMAINENGSLYVWGGNQWGSLCTGDFRNRYIPTLVTCFGIERIRNVYSSHCSFHCFVTTNHGKLYGWGRNDKAQLACVEMETINQPLHLKELESMDGGMVVDICVGIGFSIVSMSKGVVKVDPYRIQCVKFFDVDIFYERLQKQS